MNELALFAGAGGGILGGYLLGWRTVAAVEIEEYPRAILLQRQLDGILPKFPIWDDVKTFDGKIWRGKVDVISGGFPCQDISAAGKGAGIKGERSGLWKEFVRIIREVGPRFVFVENSPVLTSRGLGDVLGDLATLGYNAEWTVLGADDVGAPHRRKRIWILAYSMQNGRIERPDYTGEKRKETRRSVTGISGEALGYTVGERLEGYSRDEQNRSEPGRYKADEIRSACKASIRWWDKDPADISDTMSPGERWERWEEKRQGNIWSWYRAVEPGLGRVADGVADRVDRLKAIGNGQVPAVAALAWKTLCERAGLKNV